MTPEPPSTRLDLLVVGGMTVDRFAGGSSAPGGAVLHAARAVRDDGWRVGIVSACGVEPEAAVGRAELAALPFAVIGSAPRTIAFQHAEGEAGRELVLLERGASIAAVPQVSAGAVLHAPVAGEIDAELLRWRPTGVVAAASVQGWLRTLVRGEPVRPLPLRKLPPRVVAALRGFDLLVASREDLAEGGTPDAQLGALRSAFGDGPALVLTDGVAGAWLDLAGARWHEPVPRAVEGSTVGAGDMLSALLAVAWPQPAEPVAVRRRTGVAMRAVADRLAARH